MELKISRLLQHANYVQSFTTGVLHCFSGSTLFPLLKLRLAACKTLGSESLRLSPCVLVQPDGWALGEREGYGGPRDVTSLSLVISLSLSLVPY